MEEKMTLEELFETVRNWGRDKMIDNPDRQFVKMQEEIGELAHEISRGRLHNEYVEDALGDILVTLIIEADILDYDLEQCLVSAYNVIKNRTGVTVGGSFVKNEKEKIEKEMKLTEKKLIKRLNKEFFNRAKK